MFISKRTKDGKLRKYNYRKHRKVLLEKSNNKCILCDNRENLAIDHIVPKCVGGSNKIENLRILCTTCNNREYQKLVNEALVFYFKNK